MIEGVCDEFRLPYFACRGNNSESEQYKAGKRFEALLARGVTPIVLHLGDHDPSGLDMTRDNETDSPCSPGEASRSAGLR